MDEYKTYVLTMIIIACLTACNMPPSQIRVASVLRPDTSASNAYYAGNREPLLPLHFVKLPVGTIQPEGWLKEYLKRQRDGMTGRLMEISGWLEKKDNAWLSPDGQGNHGWEEVPYWLKGYLSLAYILNDPEMIKESQIWIEGALNSQREDGYFGPWIEKRGNPDLWGNMIMLWCLQTYYEYSQDKRVIDLMTNYFKWQKDYPEEKFLKDRWDATRAGDNLYSVYWLYNITGDAWLLDLAQKIQRNTLDWRIDSNLPQWHNVDIAQGFREPATRWLQTRDSLDLHATYNNFNLVRRIFGQVPGGMFGGDENCRMGYVDPRQGIETCGMVEQMASDEMLLRFTGDPFWAENCEDIAFNSYPAAVMPDFKALRYFTCPNMVTTDAKNHRPGIGNPGQFLIMNPYSHRCCQHNHAQGWPYYAEHLWLATPDNGLAAALFCASSVKAKVGDGTEIQLTEETNYPYEEQIHMRINTSKNVNFPLYLRIPQWCKKARISVNGSPVNATLTNGAYARIEQEWKDGDELTIDFPMEITVRQWKTNQHSISVNYGPLTFSAKIDEEYSKADSRTTKFDDSILKEDVNAEEWPSWEIKANSAWNYGLICNVENPSKSFTIEKKKWPADNFPFTQQNNPIILKAKGKRIPSWGIDKYDLCAVLPAYPVKSNEPAEDIILIPMGAARLRIASFPKVD
jgi:hypothetical protein